MASKLDLDRDEVILLQESDVTRGTSLSTYMLVLTNKKIICYNKGVFGRVNKTYLYYIDQIATLDGVPQVKRGRIINGLASLDISFQECYEQFAFPLGRARDIEVWIQKIYKLFNLSYVIEIESNSSIADDSVLGVFKGVGEMYMNMGKEFAGMLGFTGKRKANDPSNSAKNIPIQHNSNSCARCPRCGKQVTIGSKFCTFCGGAIEYEPIEKRKLQERLCPICGKKLQPDLRFCTECGTEIDIVKPILPSTQENQQGATTVKEKLTIDQQIDLLQKLKALVDSGAISQEEYEKKKKEIL